MSTIHVSQSMFTIVIVNYNGGAMLANCIELVLASCVPPEQIVLVDNGSRDGSPASLAARHPSLKIILNECNSGFARAANQGLSGAKTPYAIILNNDALISGDTLAALADAFAADPLLTIAGSQLIYPDGRSQNSVASFPRIESELLPKPLRRFIHPPALSSGSLSPNIQYVESTIGALFAVRLDQFRLLTGFDQEYFFYLEETDLCKRAWEQGFRVAKVDNAVVIHIQGATAKKHNAAARIEFQRSKRIYFRKHCSRVAYLLICAMLPLKSALNAFGALAVCVATLFLSHRARGKARQNWVVFTWYLLMCPQSWGLPDKCPPE
jgi:GT2 family glycosyltransferase